MIFDPTLKVKEEEKSDDETAPVNKASGTFLNRSPSVKLQPLDERSLKRLLCFYVNHNAIIVRRYVASTIQK